MRKQGKVSFPAGKMMKVSTILDKATFAQTLTAAMDAGMSPSEYMRMLIVKEVEKKTPTKFILSASRAHRKTRGRSGNATAHE